MGALHDKRFPGEGAAYREARDELLGAEMELRRQIEKVAEMRRSLPSGGLPPEDYVFEQGPVDLAAGDTATPIKLSELFSPGKNTLVLYSLMYGPDAEGACPMCTALLDSLNGSAPHIEQRVNFAVVAKARLPKIRAWARDRGWTNLRLLSSHGNSYNTDYFAETPDGAQIPPCNVFVKTPDGVRHNYATELLFAP
ncbi:MAG: DUF899 family protein, partial [Pseudomonadota bacterium]